LRNYLKIHYAELTEENFENFIVQGINTIHAHDVAGYANEAHYFVSGKKWKPWNGD